MEWSLKKRGAGADRVGGTPPRLVPHSPKTAELGSPRKELVHKKLTGAKGRAIFQTKGVPSLARQQKDVTVYNAKRKGAGSERREGRKIDPPV